MPEHQYDQWLVNGSPVFGVISGGLLKACPDDTPIYLFRGTTEWGWMHIEKHGRQRLFRHAGSIEELVWQKCSETGDVHSSRDPHGLTITITVAPTAFMVLRHQPAFDCFSITTMYSRRKPNPGPVIGRYVGPDRGEGRPIYAWLPYG